MDEVWNRGDFSHLYEYLAPNYEVRHDPRDPWDGKTLKRDEFIERVMYSRNAFPDLNFATREMIAEGDRVAIHWTMTGTHQGDLLQLPATGKPFAITGMTFYYFDADSKVCGHSQAFDQLAFLAQIGVLRM